MGYAAPASKPGTPGCRQKKGPATPGGAAGPVFIDRGLERQLQPEADRPGARPTDALIRNQARQRAGDFAEVRIAEGQVRVRERRGVGQVGRLRAELQLRPLGDLEFPEKRQVEVAEA